MIRYDNPEEATPGVVQTGVDGKRAIDRGVVGIASGSTFEGAIPHRSGGKKTEGGSPSCSRLVFLSLQGYGV